MKMGNKDRGTAWRDVLNNMPPRPACLKAWREALEAEAALPRRKWFTLPEEGGDER